MGWEIPWYSAQDSLKTLLVGRRVGTMEVVCYLRHGSRFFEPYWTTIRGVEAMDNDYRLLDLTVYGWRETWEDSPSGWPQGPDHYAVARTPRRPAARPTRRRTTMASAMQNAAAPAPLDSPGAVAHPPLFDDPLVLVKPPPGVSELPLDPSPSDAPLSFAPASSPAATGTGTVHVNAFGALVRSESSPV